MVDKVDGLLFILWPTARSVTRLISLRTSVGACYFPPSNLITHLKDRGILAAFYYVPLLSSIRACNGALESKIVR
jgi:hypothetical protein